MIPSGVKVFLASHPIDFRNYAAMIIMRSCHWQSIDYAGFTVT